MLYDGEPTYLARQSTYGAWWNYVLPLVAGPFAPLVSVGNYVMGQSQGSTRAAQTAAAAQASAAPSGGYYPVGPAAPGLPADPADTNAPTEAWYKQPKYLWGVVGVLAVLVVAYRATSRSRGGESEE